MGGNAVDQTYEVKPGRKPAEEYFRIMERVCWKVSNMFPWSHLAAVTAYAQKDSFGDGDILIERNHLPADWIKRLHRAFMPQNLVVNRFKGTPLSYQWDSDVPDVSPDSFAVSMDIMGLQVDFILVDQTEFHMARTYYAFNDLGNLMGRIAERLGFKYGWNGLWKDLRDEKNEVYETMLVSRNIPQIFAFLGYDYERFTEGFETLEDVFVFATSTPYFHRRPYLLENRNHKSRARDAKRKSYNAFLDWIKDRPELDKYQWAPYTGDVVKDERLREIAHWQSEAFGIFPGYHEACVSAYTRNENRCAAKRVFNGEVVRKITGLTGKLLGTFMERCRKQHDNFDAWAAAQTTASIEAFIKAVQATPEQQ